MRYIIAKKATFHKADGTIGGIVGVITDITERKITEEALKESKARFEDLSEASFETVIFIENGIIIDVNKGFHEMFGYDDNEIIGRNAADFIVTEVRTLSKEMIAAQNEETYETMGLKKDGTTFPIEVHLRELHLRERSIRISVIRDLTEQKSMEEEVLK